VQSVDGVVGKEWIGAADQSQVLAQN